MAKGCSLILPKFFVFRAKTICSERMKKAQQPRIGNKPKGVLLIAIIVLASAILVHTQQPTTEKSPSTDTFYFGVSFGGDTPQEAKTLIDRVKNYTNLLLINSYPLMTNETALNEVCDYAYQSKLKFIVYFQFISRITLPWHQTWLDSAEQRWGNMFLGVHFMDEPGGKQIDTQEPVTNASSFSDAANQFIYNINASNSMIDAKNKSISTFTSDYHYICGITCRLRTVFVELAGTSSTRQIALCRGARTCREKSGCHNCLDLQRPPYLASANEIYTDICLPIMQVQICCGLQLSNLPEEILRHTLRRAFSSYEKFWNHFGESPRERWVVHAMWLWFYPKITRGA
jgi:hypothetical protein